MKDKFSPKIPQEVMQVIEALIKEGHRAYVVGGCVRDLLLGKKPKDWDVATDAKPEKVQKIFPDSVYENKFGTVAVKTKSEKDSLKIIEITTFRIESKYSDKRHPDSVKFTKTIEEDLGRRDFTINAIALDIYNKQLIDPFGGKDDLRKKIIRAVGNPEERLTEDALRLIRTVRFAAELGFKIEKKTAEAVKKNAGLIRMVAKERVRDEFVKIVMSSGAARGINLLEETGLLEHIIPELREGIGCTQNKHHIYTVWEHNLRALDYAVKRGYSLVVRLAALLHDVGKPRTKEGEGPNATFYNHEVVGAKMTAQILGRLRFSKDLLKKVTHLVRYHLFYYNVGEVTEAAVRRFIRRVGLENIPDLIKVREADRISSGVPKAVPYKLRHLLFMVEKVRKDPIDHRMLAVKGDDVMKVAGIEQGPKVGWILAILLEKVIENPKENKKETLIKEIKKLSALSDDDLKKMADKALEKKEEFEKEIEEELKKKYYVK